MRVSKTMNETIVEIETAQAALAETIEESKRLINRSQQLLDEHRRHGAEAAAEAATARA